MEPRLKLAEPGLIIISTPIKPTIRESHRWKRTFSLSNITDNKVIIRGVENLIAAISANGKAASPMK
jgi:hypothetical protein